MNMLTPEWVTAIATVIYMFFTGWLIWETRKMRIMQEEPQIDLFIERGDDYNGKLYLIIKNNGKGGAYDLKLILNKEFETMKGSSFEEYKKLSNQGPFKNGISFLPPGGNRQLFLGIFIGEEFRELIRKEINLQLTYKNPSLKIFNKKFILSFAELENTILLPENPLFEIGKHLEKISRKIDNFASGFNQLRIITQTKQEYAKEIREHLEVHEKK